MHDKSLSQLLSALDGLPSIAVETVSETAAHERCAASLEIALKVEDTSMLLKVSRCPHPSPDYVREVAARYCYVDETKQTTTQPFFLARTIAPATRRLLEALRVGYYTSKGEFLFPAPRGHAYMLKPAPQVHEHSMRLFAGRRRDLLHTLLCCHVDTYFHAKDVVTQAGVSRTTTSETLHELERLKLAEPYGRGPMMNWRLSDPGKLLDLWAHLKRRPPREMQAYALPAPDYATRLRDVASIFDKYKVRYGVCHESAARAYLSCSRPVPEIRVRVAPDINVYKALAELDAASSKNMQPNLLIVEAESNGVLQHRGEVNGIWLTSPVQTYLDLALEGSRYTALAAALRHVRIGC
ncbi:hypothetical protein ACDA63_09715 [Uliginosibacterium sp. sgz301328]|uniref:hypothetical protein n=1 Tax=Uliginosibacterium sp. sgz301328 TaxID=3243764 RepID=UPI00359D7F64